MNFHKCLINNIEDNIYLSDWCGATNIEILKELNIGRIISLGNEKEQEFYVFHKDIEYLKIFIEDSKDSNISIYFDKINIFISQSSKGVLIHCNKGISRSVTIVIAYLMNKGMSYSKAFNKIKKIRPCIKPNIGFIQQLHSFSFI